MSKLDGAHEQYPHDPVMLLGFIHCFCFTPSTLISHPDTKFYLNKYSCVGFLLLDAGELRVISARVIRARQKENLQAKIK